MSKFVKLKASIVTSSTMIRHMLQSGVSMTSNAVPQLAVITGKLNSEDASKLLGSAAQWAAKNPGTAIGAVTCVAGLTVVAAPGLVSTPVLGVVGFGSGGVGLGTAAAGVQSTLGNVAAGGVFATLQSAGANGVGLAVVNGLVQVGGAGVTTLAGTLTYVKSKL